MWDLNTIHVMEERAHQEYLRQKPTTPLAALKEKLRTLGSEHRRYHIALVRFVSRIARNKVLHVHPAAQTHPAQPHRIAALRDHLRPAYAQKGHCTNTAACIIWHGFSLNI